MLGQRKKWEMISPQRTSLRVIPNNQKFGNKALVQTYDKTKPGGFSNGIKEPGHNSSHLRSSVRSLKTPERPLSSYTNEYCKMFKKLEEKKLIFFIEEIDLRVNMPN